MHPVTSSDGLQPNSDGLLHPSSFLYLLVTRSHRCDPPEIEIDCNPPPTSANLCLPHAPDRSCATSPCPRMRPLPLSGRTTDRAIGAILPNPRCRPSICSFCRRRLKRKVSCARDAPDAGHPPRSFRRGAASCSRRLRAPRPTWNLKSSWVVEENGLPVWSMPSGSMFISLGGC